MTDFVKNLHNHNQRAVFILDAGIGVTDNHWYDDYKSQSIFIKSSQNPTENEGNLIGAVWPGKAVFPDFWCDNTKEFWKKGIDQLKTLTDFDGLWLDMNEVTSFCPDNSGECPNFKPSGL